MDERSPPEVHNSYLGGGRSPEPQVTWVSPRRTASVASAFCSRNAQTYVLHRLLVATKIAFDELRLAKYVIVEVPPKAVGGFEHSLLKLVQKILALGPQVAILVLPAARQQAHTMMWVNRWNRLELAPFSFQRTCSCQLGRAVAGLHATIYLARSYGSVGEYATCGSIPTTGITGQAALQVLAGAVADLVTPLWDTTSELVGEFGVPWNHLGGGTTLPPGDH